MIDKKDVNDEELAEMISIMIEAQKNNEDSVQKLSKDTRVIIEKLARIELIEVEIRNLSDRVGKLEKSKTWFFRIIVGAFIALLFGILQHNKNIRLAEKKFEKKVEQTIEKTIEPRKNSKRHR